MFKKFIIVFVLCCGIAYDALAVPGCDGYYGNKCPADGGIGSAWKDYTVDIKLNEEMCGVRAYDDATGVKYMYVPADDVCVCNIADDPHISFYWGAGCFCDDGYYLADSNSTECTKCPSDYPLSTGFRQTGENTGSADNWGVDMDACYRNFVVHGQNVSLDVIEYSYGTQYIKSATCANGYYTTENWINTEYDEYYEDNDGNAGYACKPVGEEYYSVANNSREQCPSYVNMSGETVPGHTSGFGDGAASITDCAIAENETFSDATGTFVYEGGCKYSK